MNYLGEARIHAWNPRTSSNERFMFRVTELGGVRFVEVEVVDERSGNVVMGCVVELRPGHIRAELHGAPEPISRAPLDVDAIADVLARALDAKKNEDGLWVPRVKPGDALIVDKPGAPEFRVFSLEDQAFEKIPKKALDVRDDKPCTCPFTTLMSSGCVCGGKRAKAGLTEIAT